MGHHWDIDDNILLQLAGEVDITIFPANCSAGLLSRLWKVQGFDSTTPTTELVQKTGIPFFHMVLRPGDGVVLPSLAYHRVIIRDRDRIGMNVAFVPKFGQ